MCTPSKCKCRKCGTRGTGNIYDFLDRMREKAARMAEKPHLPTWLYKQINGSGEEMLVSEQGQ